MRGLGDLDLPLGAYIDIARKKTASLFAASAQCGAIMGGGSEHEIAALLEFGEAYGIAFQMNDDLLDMTADERSLGKPVGNDLTERKMTIPLVLALQNGNDRFRDRVARLYSGSSHDGIPGVIAGIAAEGGLERTRKEIASFVARAKSSLEPLPSGPAKEELTKLADALAG